MAKLHYEDQFTDEQGNFQYYQNPMKAIRAKCLHDCCAGSAEEVKNCNCTKCFLWPFRLGKNPYRTPKVYTEEELEAKRERMRQIREAKKK